ncbi:MAG: arginase [Pseudomonadota bacterium]
MPSNRSVSVGLIGVPVEAGASQRGPLMGPAALRTAGIGEALDALGHAVTDFGDVTAQPVECQEMPGVHRLGKVAGWVRAVRQRTAHVLESGRVPVLLGGDHSLSAGSVVAAAAQARAEGRPLFVLWFDAHTDFNTFESSPSGHLHGVPAAVFCGLPGLEAMHGGPVPTVPCERVCMLGIRSIDREEEALVLRHGLGVHDMRAVDEHGIAALLRPFLERVAAANGRLHVSLDVDFLEPEIAPAVGTTVPGGATVREAHLAMEMLWESGLLSSLDLVELNPFLDEAGRTARLLVDLTASLFGRRVLDRPTRSRWSRAA